MLCPAIMSVDQTVQVITATNGRTSECAAHETSTTQWRSRRYWWCAITVSGCGSICRDKLTVCRSRNALGMESRHGSDSRRQSRRDSPFGCWHRTLELSLGYDIWAIFSTADVGEVILLGDERAMRWLPAETEEPDEEEGEDDQCCYRSDDDTSDCTS